MGMEIKSTFDPTLSVRVDAAVDRGLLAAGQQILLASDAGAPREPEPRHGVHMTETGFAQVDVEGASTHRVAVGYTAFWAIWQHEDLEYHHPHGGHAKFLELAMIEGTEQALETVAEAARAALSE